MIPHYYQANSIDWATEWFSSAKRGDATVLAGPTGCGKSVVELAVQAELGIPIITPRLEIARGFLEKLGQSPSNFADLVELSQAHNIWTPIRFRNRLLQGYFDKVPGIIMDEGHHAVAESWEQLRLAAGLPPMLLLTATPFRGTARSTAKFLKDFGEPTWMITLPQAVAEGYVAMPTVHILPLVDDDLIELSSTGDFEVTSLESATQDRLADLARHSEACFDQTTRRWDRATCFCLPTVRMAQLFAETLNAPSAVITARTVDSARRMAFAALRERMVALIQVSVLGEGVDLPLRRIVDAAPCMSPVKWMQVFGRGTRPVTEHEPPPEYIVTNRNLARHAYLLEGLLPSAKLVEATESFAPSQRAGHRALGLESLGRFKASNIRLVNGLTAQFYTLVCVAEQRLREYACLVHPQQADAIWATRSHTAKSDGTRGYGQWQRCSMPDSLQGFVSQYAGEPSDKMLSWWAKQAEHCGLDPDVKLSKRNFAALPFCVALGLRLARRSQ